MEGPVPILELLQLSRYQFQLAPVPNAPPFAVNVVLLKLQTSSLLASIESAAVDDELIVISAVSPVPKKDPKHGEMSVIPVMV